jgi:hypothetical protein
MKNNIINQVICFFSGHRRVRKTTETEISMHKYSCRRCGCPLGFGVWKNAPPPPGGDMDAWELYKREMIENYLAG